MSVYQHLSEVRLKRYLAQFDLRCIYRVKTGFDDMARMGRDWRVLSAGSSRIADLTKHLGPAKPPMAAGITPTTANLDCHCRCSLAFRRVKRYFLAPRGAADYLVVVEYPMPIPNRAPTVTVSLPGEQRRLRQAILYVAVKCQSARHFGAIKLNKIIWKADFDAYRERGVPVTGREYRRQKLGPVPLEMPPVMNDMLRDGALRLEHRDYGDEIVEKRAIALDKPDMALFSAEDVEFLDRSIQHYWDMTGTEASDQSHGIAWQTRFNGDPMPYESALLSERRPGPKQWERISAIVRRREISTQ